MTLGPVSSILAPLPLSIVIPISVTVIFAPDAEVIAIADEGFRDVGLSRFRLDLTSLGDETCRPAYRERLVEFLDGLDLDEATRERARINPLRVLDDKRPHMQELMAGAPLMLDGP